MAQDATGTPTALGIPKYNTAVDAPSGRGFNAAMDAIDALLQGRIVAPVGITSGEVSVWNGSAWVRSTVTNIGAASLGSGSPDATKFLRGDGAWITVAAQANPKITVSAYSGGPPGSPADTDIWIATGVEGTANRWVFQYDSAWATDAYKWKFIGGTPHNFAQDATLTWASATYGVGTNGTGTVAQTAYSPTRSGVYQARVSAVASGTAAATVQVGLTIGGTQYNGTIFVWDLASRYSGLYAEQEAACAAASSIQPIFAVSTGTITIYNRRMFVQPSRII